MLEPDWQVSPYFLDNPSSRCLSVVGVTEPVEYQGFSIAHPMYHFQIEAAITRASDIDAQQKLDDLMDGGASELKAALEADPKLTSRYQDDGTILSGQAPACDDLEVVFQGMVPRFRLESGVDALLATWAAQVWT